MLYADVNFNGVFDHDEKFEKAPPPPVVSTGLIPVGWSSHTFQPIILNVPYNDDAKGVTNPCEIVFRYQRYRLPRGFEYSGESVDLLSGAVETDVRTQAKIKEEFSVRRLIRLRENSDTWEYSFEGPVTPSEKLKSAPVCDVEKKLKLQVSIRPDGRKEGNLGVALEISAGENEFECRQEGQIVKAHVEIKQLDGTVVHRGDDTLDKFRFG